MAVPVDRITQQLLQWLHSVLTPEYLDTRRTYSDIIHVLRLVPSLSPRTNVYTHENGRSQLLLCLHGTLPATFRGQTYNIPVLLWIPHQYPQQSPIAFVSPSKDMLIRPGNHVDASGRCYHPYLANWTRFPERSNVAELCDILKGVFSREPPVYARPTAQTGTAPQVATQSPTPPPRPPLPAELDPKATTTSSSPPPASRPPAPPVPPPVPPLPKELAPPTPVPLARPPVQPPAPPPPPPKPSQAQPLRLDQQVIPGGHARPSSLVPAESPTPPLPPAPHRALSQQLPQPAASGRAYSGIFPHIRSQSPPQRPVAFQQFQHQQHIPPTHHVVPPRPQPPPPLPPPPFISPSISQPPAPQRPPRPLSYHAPPQVPHNPSAATPYPPQLPPSVAQQPKIPKPSIVDIMNMPDTDILLSGLPSEPKSTYSALPPPLPPNPQKDQILSEILKAVNSRAEAATMKTNQALEQAAAQREAIMRAEVNMEKERTELLRIGEICEKDERILRESMVRADEVIRDARMRDVPEVDKVVCAPTVVHTQLYDLVTEDMAIGDAIYVLGKALDRDRIGLDVFLRHTRTLAREQFLLRATVKKIVNQIGLVQ